MSKKSTDHFYAAWVEHHGEQCWFQLFGDDFDDAPLLFERRKDLIECTADYRPAVVLRKVVVVKMVRPSLQPLEDET